MTAIALARNLSTLFDNYARRLQRDPALAPAHIQDRLDTIYQYLAWLTETGSDSLASRSERTSAAAAYEHHLRRHNRNDSAGVDEALNTVEDFHRRVQRGGNRLPVGHPARGRPPRWTWCKAMPRDRERRDRNQRERTTRAADLALARGELAPQERLLLGVLMSFSDRRCKDPIFASRETIGRRAGGLAPTTVTRLTSSLMAKGWLSKVHRCRHSDGRFVGETNLYRVDIPDALRTQLQGQEDAARSRSRSNTSPRRYTPPTTASTPGDHPPTEADGTAEFTISTEPAPVQKIDPQWIETATSYGLDHARKRLRGPERSSDERSPP